MSDFEDTTVEEADDEESTSSVLVDDEVQPDVDDEAIDGEAIDADDLLDEEAAPPVESPYDRAGRWYVVHTQSGYEKKVKQNLEARISSMNMEERIHEVVIPMEDVIEFKNGKKVVVQKKVFPGYLLVRCDLDDDSWYVIRNTPGVTGFVGAGSKPSPRPVCKIRSTSGWARGTGFAPAPTKPVTPGVFFTTVQASSVMSMLTRT
jgi:transcriptional antiterminator NusG